MEAESVSHGLEAILADIWKEYLRLDAVNSKDDFFELGGHSVLAVGMLERVRVKIGPQLELPDLFRAPTLGAFTRKVHASLGDTEDSTKGEVDLGPLPLTSAQTRIWFMQQMAPDAPSYHLIWAFKVLGALVPAALDAAFTTLVQRHPVLRLSVADGEDGPMQFVKPAPKSVVSRAERAKDDSRPDAELEREAVSRALRPFDLNKELPLRVELLKLGAREWRLLVTLHHIAGDGWSQQIMMREVETDYERAVRGLKIEPGQEDRKFFEFAKAEKQWLTTPDSSESLMYWTDVLQEPLPRDPFDVAAKRQGTYETAGGVLVTDFGSEVLTSIRSLAQEEKTTPFVVLLAAFYAALNRVTRLREFVIGTDIGGRGGGVGNDALGLFVNQLALREKVNDDEPFANLLKRVREHCVAAFEHERVPFNVVVKAVRPQRVPGANPIFQVMFILQNVTPRAVKLFDVNVEALEIQSHHAPFDLTVAYAMTMRGTLRLDLRFRSQLFHPAEIQTLSENMESVLKAVVAKPTDHLLKD